MNMPTTGETILGTGRPSGGAAILALALSPTGDGSPALAATIVGLLVSHDGGRTWGADEGPMGRAPILAAAFSPAFASDRLALLGGQGTICRAHDLRGWLPARLPRANICVTSLACSTDFAEDGVVLAATAEDGVLRSGDRGASFETWNFGLLDLEVVALTLSPHFGHDGIALAATPTGLYRTTNGGRSWREVLEARAAAAFTGVVSAEMEGGARTIAIAEDGAVYRSDDLGQHWRVMTMPRSVGDLTTVALLPGGTIIVGATTGIAHSRDGGDTWADWPTAAPVISLASHVPPATAGTLLVGLADGTILRADSNPVA